MIDLHLHSTCSDGRHSPTRLVELLHARGILGAALTDHDTQAGSEEFCRAAHACGMYALPGVEVSARLRPVEKRASSNQLPVFSAEGAEVHLLVYGIPAGEGDFDRLLSAIRQERVRRFDRMLECLYAEGVEVERARFSELLATGSAGRPHLAAELLRLGVVNNFAQAFHRYLANDKPAGVAKELPAAAEVVRIAHAQDGLVVLAHPGKSLPDSEFLPALHCGVDGLEARHPGHKGGQSKLLMELARRNKLIWTAGSDYHGVRDDGSDYHPPRFSLQDLSDRFTRRLRRACRL